MKQNIEMDEKDKLSYSAFSDLKDWAEWYACCWPWCPLGFGGSGLLPIEEFEQQTDESDWRQWLHEDQRFIMDKKGRIHETAWQAGILRQDIDIEYVTSL